MKRMTTWVLGLAVLPVAASAQQTLEFSGYTWQSDSPDARVESFMGRESLRLRNGAVMLSGIEFENGVIEYDVATTGHRSFVGTAFRLRQESRVEYEHFYIRPHQTGRFDATQYTPEINGLAAWQLYPEFNAPIDVPRDEWIHVRLVVAGSRLEAYVGDGAAPALVVSDLRLGEMPGLVGLTSNFPAAEGLPLYPTAYSNFKISTDAAPMLPAADESPAEPGTIMEWQLSESRAGSAGALDQLDAETLATLTWEAIETDTQGRINVAEYRSFPAEAYEAHVYARVTVTSDRARTTALNFGFSDRGLVFLNGRLLFSGDNTYRSRSMRYLGVMTVENDALFLPLDAGDNELVFVVSESFGGWGLIARLGDQAGITVSTGGANGG
jgi:hypothetical protein